MPLNTGKKVINDCCFIDFNRKQNEGKRIMQKLIRIKTANEALYIGRLLPKKSEKTKKAQKQKHIYPYKTKTKKLFLLPYGEKSSKQKKIYNKGKYKENEEKQDKT